MKVTVIDDYYREIAGEDSIKRLQEAVELIIYEKPFPSQDALVKALHGVEAVIANRDRTRFTAELLARLPDLRLISNTGGNLSHHVDTDAATRHGILLSNAPGDSAPAMAELTIGLIIALVRRIATNHALMRSGEWPRELLGSVHGKILGILGMGKIGARVARVAQALDMEVVAWGPTLTDERAKQHGARRIELDDLIRTADFISIHVVLSEISRGLLSRERIALMKPSAYLINTARAAITDEEALIEALAAGRIAGAGLDVYMQEPLPKESPIRKLDNVVLSPHRGTRESYALRKSMADENVLAYMAGNPVRVQNPEAMAKSR